MKMTNQEFTIWMVCAVIIMALLIWTGFGEAWSH